MDVRQSGSSLGGHCVSSRTTLSRKSSVCSGNRSQSPASCRRCTRWWGCFTGCSHAPRSLSAAGKASPAAIHTCARRSVIAGVIFFLNVRENVPEIGHHSVLPVVRALVTRSFDCSSQRCGGLLQSVRRQCPCGRRQFPLREHVPWVERREHQNRCVLTPVSAQRVIVLCRLKECSLERRHQWSVELR